MREHKKVVCAIIDWHFLNRRILVSLVMMVTVSALFFAGCVYLPLTSQTIDDLSLLTDERYGYTLFVSHGFTVEEDIIVVKEDRQPDGSLSRRREQTEIFQRILPTIPGIASKVENSAQGTIITVDFGDYTSLDGTTVENKFRFLANKDDPNSSFHLIVPVEYGSDPKSSDDLRRCRNARDVVSDSSITNKAYIVELHCAPDNFLRTPYLNFRVDESRRYRRYEATPAGRTF